MKNNEIQVLNACNLREKKDVGTLLNEWEKLAALSNRRLTMQSLHILFNLTWSIDRITIVGELNEFDCAFTYISEDGEIIYTEGEKFTLNQAMPILERHESAERVGKGWKLVDKYGENIAYVETLPFRDRETGAEKGRIDFNPNKIQAFLNVDLKTFVATMFKNPHFSRADIACDVLDLPDDYISQYRLSDAVSFRPYYGQGGQLETVYFGARSSERQLRMYNKLLEQTKHKKVVPSEIKTWWRIELQLRRSKASDWIKVVNETLDAFYSPNYMPADMKATDKVMIVGLHADHQLFSQLAIRTRQKYRNLMREIAKEDELTQHLKSSFSENIEYLKRELETWLGRINVKEEE